LNDVRRLSPRLTLWVTNEESRNEINLNLFNLQTVHRKTFPEANLMMGFAVTVGGERAKSFNVVKLSGKFVHGEHETPADGI
jgi:hypothetical protein